MARTSKHVRCNAVAARRVEWFIFLHRRIAPSVLLREAQRRVSPSWRGWSTWFASGYLVRGLVAHGGKPAYSAQPHTSQITTFRFLADGPWDYLGSSDPMAVYQWSAMNL